MREVLQEVARDLKGDPPGGDHNGPKVKAGMALKGEVDLDKELDTHPQAHSAECGNDAESSGIPSKGADMTESPVIVSEGDKMDTFSHVGRVGSWMVLLLR